MRAGQRVSELVRIERLCDQCGRDLIVLPVHDFLEGGWTRLGDVDKLRRIQARLGGRQKLTWCSDCFRFALPTEAVTL